MNGNNDNVNRDNNNNRKNVNNNSNDGQSSFSNNPENVKGNKDIVGKGNNKQEGRKECI